MEAIILAGGMGTRLRKAVPDVPKPMAPVKLFCPPVINLNVFTNILAICSKIFHSFM
jgi:dTDP-glucose pyrophosphorylase